MSGFASGCLFVIFLLLVIAAPVIAVIIATPKKRLYKVTYFILYEDSTLIEARDELHAIRKFNRRYGSLVNIVDVEEFDLVRG